MPTETELQLFMEMWNRFKLKLLMDHPVNCPSTRRSLFLLELESHRLNNDLGLSSDELKSVDSFLLRFEDHCITRIMLKFEKFKSSQDELKCRELRHPADAGDEGVEQMKTCTMVQTENSSAKCVSPLKDTNEFLSAQKPMLTREVLEQSDNSEDLEACQHFGISNMSQIEQGALGGCSEIPKKPSVIQKLYSHSSKRNNGCLKRSIDGSKSHKMSSTLIVKPHSLQQFDDETPSGDAGLTETVIKSSSKSEKLSSHGVKVQTINHQLSSHGVKVQKINHQSKRSGKQLLCPICGFEYQNTRLLKEHIKSHSGDGKLKCTSCNSAFKQRNSLEPPLPVCLCGQNSGTSTKQIDNSCKISDSVIKLRVESQHLSNKQQSRQRTPRCTHQLNCQTSSISCSLKSDSNSYLKDKPKYKQFTCDICHGEFHGLTKMKRHQLSHSGEKPHRCNVCGTAFADKSHLNVHARLHSDEKPFKCTICESTFSESTKLKNHNRIHTGEKPYVCEICGLSFSVSSSLKSHMKIHSGKRQFKCNVCDFASVHSSNLKAHLVVHTGDKRFRCDTCGASFTESAKLKRHKMVHTGEKPYNCEICGARFADKSHLTVHMRIHSGEKPFKCTFCDSAFVESSKLKNHVRTHTGEKPYVCEICGMSFAVSFSLKSHMRRHTGEKLYKCDICGYLTSHSSNLKTHMIVHTGVRSHVCDMCGATFSELSKLKRHKVIHLDQKDGSDENLEQNCDQLTSLPSELFYNFSAGSDGMIPL